MSEYQYYEFQAIDLPLTERQIRELRRYSTRASITSTRFVNHDEWGDFKGDASAWMAKYFDAFLYHSSEPSRFLHLWQADDPPLGSRRFRAIDVRLLHAGAFRCLISQRRSSTVIAVTATELRENSTTLVIVFT